MPKGRPRGSTKATSKRTAVLASKDAGLLGSIEALVARNRELINENARLRALVDAIAKSVQSETSVAGALQAAVVRRPGRPRKLVAPPKRTRKKITDPVVLEKRREALAKARAVRAERLAQTKT